MFKLLVIFFIAMTMYLKCIAKSEELNQVFHLTLINYVLLSCLSGEPGEIAQPNGIITKKT